MRIVVLEGSPNKNGSSNMLANKFIEGAEKSGNSVKVISAPHINISPCTGCIHCGYEGPCALNDDMQWVKSEILSSDMIVFVTPLYYYGMSAQLKTLIDRFCSFNSSLQRKHMKSAMLSVAWNSDDWTFEALETHYKRLVKYLNLDNKGAIWGKDCGTPTMTKNSIYPDLAYEFGKNLK